MDKYTVAVVDFLRNHPGVSGLSFHSRSPATTAAIHAWEAAHAPHKLPEDLKAFLLLSDGFSLRWDVCFGGRTHALGNMALNGIQGLGTELVLDASPADDASDGLVIVPPGGGGGGGGGWGAGGNPAGGAGGAKSEAGSANVGGGKGSRKGGAAAAAATKGKGGATGGDGGAGGGTGGGAGGGGEGGAARVRGWEPPVPTAAFDLDASCTCGRVALVFVELETTSPSSSPQQQQGQPGRQQGAQVWFQDLSTRWHVMAGSFSEYFRVMAAHLGVGLYNLNSVDP
jgi:hypothetical protein